MASSVLNSLPLLLITAGLALLAASVRLARLARQHRQRMEALLQLAQQEIDPLELPAAAWPQLAEAGWQSLAWQGRWFGQPLAGSLGISGKGPGPALHFETGSGETTLQLEFIHPRSRGEQRLFAEQLARVFVLLLETRLRARSEALHAALAERARLSLYLQHDMRNLAQWVSWISTDLAASTNPQNLQETAERLQHQAPLARDRAERLIAALAQHPASESAETVDLARAIRQAAQLAGFEPEIDGAAQAWIAKGLLARALDNLFADLAATWRHPQALHPVFQLRNPAMAEISFFAPWPEGCAPIPAEKLFEPFAEGRPGGLGLALHQARKSLGEGGGELDVSPEPEGLHFLLRLPKQGM